MVDDEGGEDMADRKRNIKSLTSIVSYPERGEGGSNRYRGNCSPRLVEDLIGFFHPEMICDYMCGSGTAPRIYLLASALLGYGNLLR